MILQAISGNKIITFNATDGITELEERGIILNMQILVRLYKGDLDKINAKYPYLQISYVASKI